MIDVNWTTVILAVVGSLLGAGGATGGVLFKLGRTFGAAQTNIDNHEARMNQQNGTLKKQERIDAEIAKKISSIEANCKERLPRFDRNDREHDEIFGRLRSLEMSVASIPGQVSQQIDQRFKEWRGALKSDVRLAIHDYWRHKENRTEEDN